MRRAIARRGGSSPLTRGKRVAFAPAGEGERLIPAHAGKTRSFGLSYFKVKAHPRSRGENLTPAGKLVINGGSSPLTRGKRDFARDKRFHVRLIPAHAGKTLKQP